MRNLIFIISQSMALVLLAAMVLASAREWGTTWAIARQTWREAIRKKTLWLVLVFAFLFLAWTTFIQAVGASAIREERRLQMMLYIGFCAMSFFSVLAAIFLASFSLPTDITDRTVYTILSKPVSRWSLMVGKIVGLSLVVLAMLAVMGAILVGVVMTSSSGAPTEVRDRLLSARSIIQASRVEHVAIGQAVPTADQKVFLTIRHYLPQIRYEFTIPDTESLKSAESIVLRFEMLPLVRIHSRMKDQEKEGKPHEEGEKSETKKTVELDFALLDPVSGREERYRTTVDTEKGVSEPVTISPALSSALVASGQIVVKDHRLNPAFDWGKTPFLEPSETGRWVFQGMERLDLEYDPVGGARSGSEGAATEAVAPGPGTPKRIRAQLRFRVRDWGDYVGVKTTDVQVGYRRPKDKELRGQVPVRVRDGATIQFDLPADALSDAGGLVIELTNPREGSHHLGYDQDTYPLVLLSRPSSFELNVARAILMISLQAVLLIAVAVSASTFLSWPVTALTTVFVGICGAAKTSFGELIEALHTTETHGAHSHNPIWLEEATWFKKFTEYVIQGLDYVMPDLSQFSPASVISRGYAIELSDVMRSFGYMAIFFTIVLAAGWLIFRRRSID